MKKGQFSTILLTKALRQCYKYKVGLSCVRTQTTKRDFAYNDNRSKFKMKRAKAQNKTIF